MVDSLSLLDLPGEIFFDQIVPHQRDHFRGITKMIDIIWQIVTNFLYLCGMKYILFILLVIFGLWLGYVVRHYR